MFTSITWEIFFGTLFTLVLGYYAITTLLLYSTELQVWVKGLFKTSSTPSTKEEHPVSESKSIMGDVSLSDAATKRRVIEITDQDIAVTSNDEVQEPIQPLRQGTAASADNLLVGSVADLLEEIKTLVELIGEYKSSKAESQAFFNALFLRYPQLTKTSYQEAINIYLLDTARHHFSFEVSLPEIASWWTTPAPTNK